MLAFGNKMQANTDSSDILIAEREFSVEHEGHTTPGKLRIYKPKEDGNDWCCSYEIECKFGTDSGHVYGIDAIQALLLTVRHIQQMIDEYVNKNGAIAYHLSKDISALNKFSDDLSTIHGLIGRLYENWYMKNKDVVPQDPQVTEPLRELSSLFEKIESIIESDRKNAI